MGNEGIILWTAFGREYFRHRLIRKGLAARPYTVSVGMPTTSPARKRRAASATDAAPACFKQVRKIHSSVEAFSFSA